jgi:hypothetical protein
MDRPCLCDQLQPMMRHPVDRLVVWLEKCHQFALCTVCIQHGQRQVMWTLHFETWAGYFKSMTFIKLSFFVIYHWDRNSLKLFQPHTLLGTWYLLLLSSHKGPPTNKPIRISLVNPYKPLWMGLIGSPWVPFFWVMLLPFNTEPVLPADLGDVSDCQSTMLSPTREARLA